MQEFEFDLFVIGGGSGGVRAARMAAEAGAAVGLADPSPLGGTCVNVGCIPKKLYSFAAHYAEAFEEAAGFGWSLPQQPSFDWDTLKRRRRSEILRLNGVYRELLERAGVHVLAGRAEVLDPHSVRVNGRCHRARNILVSTGARPRVADIPGTGLLVTSESMFDLPQFPQKLIILGGGYIACEFASIFRGLGSSVTLVHRGNGLLAGFDHDVRSHIATEMRESGIDLRLTTSALEVTLDGRRRRVRLSDGTHVDGDVVLCAMGRQPNSSGIGLEEVGVKLSGNGAILVNDRQQTSIRSIHAVGDVSSSLQLTPVALAEAMILVDRLFGSGAKRIEYEFVPSAVFTHPNIASVGFTEMQARMHYDDIEVYRSIFRPLKHTLSGRNSRALVKLIVEAQSQRVVGLHMVGDEAGEVVQGFAVALRAGLTKAQFDCTLGIHPTIAEEFVTLRTPVAP